jgi:lipoprotein-releasing system ATP-binding protein
MNESLLVKSENLTKSYVQGQKKIVVLNGLEMQIKKNTINIITGKSGSGKSTLLHIVGGLDKPDSGSVKFNEHDICSFNEKELNKFRNDRIGFVFQFHNLLSDFTVYENIIIPAQIKGQFNETTKQYAEYLIEFLGIKERISHYPNQLSGGEQQRTAIARALINKPDLLLADEPTGNLDNETATHVTELFMNIKKNINTTMIIVTHDAELYKNPDCRFLLANSKLSLI